MSAVKHSPANAARSFEVVKDCVDGHYRSFARFQCCCCPTHKDVRLNRDFNNQSVMSIAHHAGWQETRRGWVCPEHRAGRAGAAENKEATMGASQLPADRPALSTDQKARIRLELDKCFDDAAGRYLDGMSDHQVATKVGLPMAEVRAFRELAYGELKTDDELAGLEAELQKIEKVLPQLRADVGKLSDRVTQLEGQQMSLRSRVNGCERRIGITK